MTRKDFEALAGIIWKHEIKIDNPAFFKDLLVVLKNSNSLFDPKKFSTACDSIKPLL